MQKTSLLGCFLRRQSALQKRFSSPETAKKALSWTMIENYPITCTSRSACMIAPGRRPVELGDLFSSSLSVKDDGP